MASITIRKLDEGIKARLQVQAAQEGRSIVPADDLADAIGRRFRDLGGIELPPPAREPMREPPKPGR